jgi:hypothetical protein
VDGLFLPRDNVFETAAGIEVVNDWEDGYGPDVEWVSGIL